MRTIVLVLLAVLLANHRLPAATPQEEAERLRVVAEEVAARRLIREHDSGRKKATDAQLAAARALILKNKETRVRAAAPGPDGGFALNLKDADMATVAQRWGDVLGYPLGVAARLKAKRVSLSVTDASVEVFLNKLEMALKQQGVHLVFDAAAATLDAEPPGPRRN